MLVDLKNVRLAFPSLFKATAMQEGDTPYYSALFPIKPGSDNDKALRKAISTVLKEAFGAKAQAREEALAKGNRIFYKEGPKVSSSTGEVYAGFEDMNHARCSNAHRIVVVDRAGSPVTEADGLFYPGCVVNVKVDVWYQPIKGTMGNRVNGRLLGVQFAKDAEAFGGGVRITADSFSNIEDEEEEGSLD